MPNHGFRILDSQLLMRIIFLLAYADIFFSYATEVRKHTLRNLLNALLSGSKNRNLTHMIERVPLDITSRLPKCKYNESWNDGTRTHNPSVNSRVLYPLSYKPIIHKTLSDFLVTKTDTKLSPINLL